MLTRTISASFFEENDESRGASIDSTHKIWVTTQHEFEPNTPGSGKDESNCSHDEQRGAQKQSRAKAGGGQKAQTHLPHDTIEHLRRRATLNNRTLSAEIADVLESAIKGHELPPCGSGLSLVLELANRTSIALLDALTDMNDLHEEMREQNCASEPRQAQLVEAIKSLDLQVSKLAEAIDGVAPTTGDRL